MAVKLERCSEVSQLQLLRRLPTWRRLDVLPFAIVYIAYILTAILSETMQVRALLSLLLCVPDRPLSWLQHVQRMPSR